MESNEDHSDILGKVERFENMLSSSDNLYFDREDFQELVDYYLSISEYDKANTVLNYAFEQHPGSPDLKIAYTHVLIANNEFKKALETITEIEALQPDNGDVLMAKGTIFSRLKMSSKALDSFNKALDMVEFKEDVYFLMAMEHQRSMEYEKAIKFHELALRENTLFELSLYEVNVCYDCLGDYPNAVVFYTRFLDHNPYSETAWFNLGAMYAKMEDDSNAIEAYDYALAINPYFTSALFNKANALASSNRYEEAVECYKETFEIESPNYITYCYIGECYERLQNHREALKYFQKAIREEKEYPDAWLGKAIALDHLNNTLEAYDSIKMALSINDTEPDYWYTIAELEEKLGLVSEAIKSMKQAISLDKGDLDLTISYIQMASRIVDFKELNVVIDESLENFPLHDKILLLKGGYYLKNKLEKEGLKYIQKALLINPEGDQYLFEHFPEIKNDAHLLKMITKQS